MAGNNSITTASFLNTNFPAYYIGGGTPSTNNTIGMSCAQIQTNYNLEIVNNITNRLPSQNQISIGDLIYNVDYIVMTYTWTSIQGVDLDTITMATGSGVVGLDGEKVGYYCGGSSPGNTNVLDIMFWGGDNTTSGDETALIDINELKTHSLNTETTFSLYGIWYDTKGTGGATVTVEAYSGGTISKTGTVYTIVGGTEVYSDNKLIQIDETWSSGESCDTTKYDKLGDVIYNSVTGEVEVIF